MFHQDNNIISYREAKDSLRSEGPTLALERQSLSRASPIAAHIQKLDNINQMISTDYQILNHELTSDNIQIINSFIYK